MANLTFISIAIVFLAMSSMYVAFTGIDHSNPGVVVSASNVTLEDYNTGVFNIPVLGGLLHLIDIIANFIRDTLTSILYMPSIFPPIFQYSFGIIAVIAIVKGYNMFWGQG